MQSYFSPSLHISNDFCENAPVVQPSYRDPSWWLGSWSGCHHPHACPLWLQRTLGEGSPSQAQGRAMVRCKVKQCPPFLLLKSCSLLRKTSQVHWAPNQRMFTKHLFSEQRIQLREGEETGRVRSPPERGFCEQWLARCGGYELFGGSTAQSSEGF